MTDFEIWKSFTQSKNKKNQLQILSELNCMEIKELKKIINKVDKKKAAYDREYNKLLKKARPNTPVQISRGYSGAISY